jgi:beta-mannanase
MWVPHNATALNTRANQPRAYWPGKRYVDWVGTDFYGQNPNWGALERIYSQFPGKPFVFGEWAPWGRDDPSFVRRLFAFVRTHRRVRMLVYNQGERADGPFRLKRYPRVRRALRAALARR